MQSRIERFVWFVPIEPICQAIVENRQGACLFPIAITDLTILTNLISLTNRTVCTIRTNWTNPPGLYWKQARRVIVTIAITNLTIPINLNANTNWTVCMIPADRINLLWFRTGKVRVCYHSHYKFDHYNQSEITHETNGLYDSYESNQSQIYHREHARRAFVTITIKNITILTNLR